MPETKLDWCLSNKNRLKKIQPSQQLAVEHIKKAKHNLLAADYNIKGKFNDWAVSQCYVKIPDKNPIFQDGVESWASKKRALFKPRLSRRGAHRFFDYATYHGLLSLLYKFGFESKNHECTFEAIKYLIESKKINLELKDIAFIKTTEQINAQDAKSLREEFQYGTKTDVNNEIINELAKRAKEIVEKIELIIISDTKSL